jgi:ribose/xylose/arabinose/galactoside ABC-type transport system permease subunit
MSQAQGWREVLTGPSAAHWRSRVTNDDVLIKFTAPLALLVVCVTFTVLSPHFLTSGNVNGMLSDASLPIMLAIGSTFVIAIGGIDLSLAATVALSSVILGLAYQHGWPLALDCALCVVTGVAVGVVNGFVVGWIRIPDFIVTLGSLSFVMGIGLVLSGGKPVEITSKFFTDLSTNSIWIFRYDLIFAVVVAAGLHFVLFHTPFGTHLLATGGNLGAARAMGIRVARVKLACYVVCGAMGGLMAVMLTAYVGAAEPATNTDYLLQAIAAVVLGGVSLFGGRASIIGPVLGAVLLTVLSDGLTLLGVSAFYEPIVVGVVVVAAATVMRSKQ